MIETPTNKHASPSGELQAEIIRAISDAIRSLGYSIEGLDLTLRPIPLEGAWGFGSAVAFQLKKQGAQGSPMEIAERVAEALPSLEQVERVEVVNNYLNFYVGKDWYANRVVAQVLSEQDAYGCWPPRGERVMVEYANLNTHKDMHVGHLRNVVLGAAVFNILKCAGFDTVGATYIGDIGLHVMRTMWAYMSFHRGQEPDTDRGAWLEKIYVEAVARQEYRNDVVSLIEDAAKADPAIAAHLTLALQALADNDLRDRPHAEKLAETLLTRDGPDWKDVLATRDHIVLNLWHALGEMLVAQSSTMDTSNTDAAPLRGPGIRDQGSGIGKDDETQNNPKSGRPLGHQNLKSEDPLAAYRNDYNRLDAHRDWWDEVPRWQAEVKTLFARWEAQEPEVVEVWNTTREWSLEMLRRIFGDMGIHFDAWFFESEVEHPGKEVVDELIQKGIAEDLRSTGGPVIVRVDDKLREHPELSKRYEKELFKTGKEGIREPKEAFRVLVVLRSDGTSLYATKDLELARRKFNQWHIDRALYVVDTAQALYLQQIFRVLELWGFPQAQNCFHLAYERVTTPEGAISSRKGGAPSYEEFEKEAIARARAVVEAKEAGQSRNLTEDQKEAIAKSVAYGALKMGMLDKDNNKVIVFEWEQALNPESQSAAYVQYSYARATRVLEKAPAEMLPAEGVHYEFKQPELAETNLLELIARLPEEVARSAETYKPVIIATYCFDLADAFNTFYHNCPILKAPSEEQIRSRLALTAAAKQTLHNALALLGIGAPPMM